MSVINWDLVDAHVRRWIDYSVRLLHGSTRPNVPPTLLTDVDGVLVDFCGRVLDLVRQRWPDTKMTVDDIDGWAVEAAISRLHGLEAAEGRKILFAWLESDEFWRNMQTTNFAQHIKGVPHDTIAVTSPWVSCKTWMHHRHALLREHGIDRIMVTDQKRYVFGDVLIEDKWSNLESWLRTWPEGRGVFVQTPYSDPIPGEFSPRVWILTNETAAGVMEEVQMHLAAIARARPAAPSPRAARPK